MDSKQESISEEVSDHQQHDTTAKSCNPSNSQAAIDTCPASSLVVEQPQEVVRPVVDGAVNSGDQTTVDNKMAPKVVQKQHKKWNRRLKMLFCCLGYKKNKDSIADVASLLAEFHSDLNIRPTDLAAGFVLLSKYQAAQRQYIVDNHKLNIEQYLSSVPITPETKFISLSTAEDSHLINDLIYYMNYSLATFGWPLQAFDEPCTMCCVCPYLKLSCCSKRRRRQRQLQRDGSSKKAGKATSGGVDNNAISASAEADSVQDKIVEIKDTNDKPNQQVKDRQKDQSSNSISGITSQETDFAPIILEDNCCGCNMASFEYRMAAHNFEVVYITYKATINIVPFLVVADHSKQSIVVAIRGSMGLSDMVTDMNGTIDPLPIDNCPPDWLCHRGITRAAVYVKNKLLDEKILETAFNCRPDLGTNEYSLIFCGHSLGAGVAAILGIIMRSHYPNLKSYLYSPPGGILSLPAVEYTKEFSIGILLGNDCVPRLGMAQLERLRYHTLLSLKSSNRSAGKVLAKAICPSFVLGGNKVDYDPSLSLNLLHGTGGRPFDFNGSKIQFQIQPRVLYVPGRLIHIVKNHTFQSRTRRLFTGPLYQAIWTENTDYDRIMISEGMFRDHLPSSLMHAMKMLFSRTLPARKESSNLSTSVVTPPPLQTTEVAACDTLPNSTATTTCTSPQPDFCYQISEEGSKTSQMIIRDGNNNNSDTTIEPDENNNSSDSDSNNNNTNELQYPKLETV